LLESLFHFLANRDTKAAIEVLQKCAHKVITSCVWRLNLAFLYAYEGNLGETLRQYCIVADYKVEPITLAQIEEFLCWIIEEEPDKYQFYFCLGYINWRIKGDAKRAILDFEEFLQLRKINQFEREHKLVTSWLKQLQKIH
jgi:hypothetical protein